MSNFQRPAKPVKLQKPIHVATAKAAPSLDPDVTIPDGLTLPLIQTHIEWGNGLDAIPSPVVVNWSAMRASRPTISELFHSLYYCTIKSFGPVSRYNSLITSYEFSTEGNSSARGQPIVRLDVKVFLSVPISYNENQNFSIFLLNVSSDDTMRKEKEIDISENRLTKRKTRINITSETKLLRR
jgi:hypothetical protein